MADAEIARQRRTAQIEIAISQLQVFVFDFAVDFKRRNFRTIKDFERINDHLDLTRGEIGIRLTCDPCNDMSVDLDHVFVT